MDNTQDQDQDQHQDQSGEHVPEMMAALEALSSIVANLSAASVADTVKRDGIVNQALNLIEFGLADVARQVVEPGS